MALLREALGRKADGSPCGEAEAVMASMVIVIHSTIKLNVLTCIVQSPFGNKQADHGAVLLYSRHVAGLMFIGFK